MTEKQEQKMKELLKDALSNHLDTCLNKDQTLKDFIHRKPTFIGSEKYLEQQVYEIMKVIKGERP